MKRRWSCIFVLPLLAAVWATVAWAQSPRREDSGWRDRNERRDEDRDRREDAPTREAGSTPDYRERYGIISEWNVFLRERRRRREERPPETRPAFVPRPAEESYALRGVVYEDGEFRAYIENLRTGSMMRLRMGEELARGTVSNIAMDAIEYEQGGRRVWVDVGRNLTGSLASASEPASGSEASPGATSQPAGGAINPNDPNLTPEQKMRLRRQQLLNQK